MKEIKEALQRLQQVLEAHTCHVGSDEAEFCEHLHHTVIESQKEITARGYGADSETV